MANDQIENDHPLANILARAFDQSEKSGRPPDVYELGRVWGDLIWNNWRNNWC